MNLFKFGTTALSTGLLKKQPVSVLQRFFILGALALCAFAIKWFNSWVQHNHLNGTVVFLFLLIGLPCVIAIGINYLIATEKTRMKKFKASQQQEVVEKKPLPYCIDYEDTTIALPPPRPIGTYSDGTPLAMLITPPSDINVTSADIRRNWSSKYSY